MFFLIAGPCVIESEGHAVFMAETLKQMTDDLGIPFIFKASWRKANRTSHDSYDGVTGQDGIKVFERIRNEVGCLTTTDVHEEVEAYAFGDVVDVLQIPAMLSRQTGLIAAAARSNASAVTIKKGQFMAPWDVQHAVRKAHDFGEGIEVGLIERGVTFGYNNLIVDPRSFHIMREQNPNCPIIFDVTHSCQLPGGSGARSGGQREFAAPLARAAIGVGIDGLFIETHDKPEEALSDGPNMIPLDELPDFLKQMMEIWSSVQSAAGGHPRTFSLFETARKAA